MEKDNKPIEVSEEAEAVIIPETPEQTVAAMESEQALSDAPALDLAVSEEPQTVEVPAPAEEKPEPGYGAPQMLYEDFIPFEYLHGSEEKPAEEAKSKKDSLKPKKEKAKKPTKEEELAAAVEAEMASREDVDAAIAPPDTPIVLEEPEKAEEDAVVIKDPVIAPVAPLKEEAVMADKKEKAPQEKKEYSFHERKLRRKYGLDKDILLSGNDIVPGFVLAKGENVVRCYNCLASKKGEGTVCLTNRRLMINADERSEVAVNMVTGIKFARNTYFSVAKFIFGLLFLLLGAAMVALPFFRDKVTVPYVTGDYWKNWFMYLFIACGAVSVLISLPLLGTMVKKFFYFTVFVNEGAPFLECKSSSFVKSEKKGKQYNFVVTNAGKESEKAARELGALILEVKEGRYDF